MAAHRTALLRLSSAHDRALWRAALASHDVPSLELPDDGRSLVDVVLDEARHADAGALVVDLPALLALGHSAQRFAPQLKRARPSLAIYARLPHRARVTTAQRTWVRGHGFDDLLPGSSARHVAESLGTAVGTVLGAFGRGEPDIPRMRSMVEVLGGKRPTEANEAVAGAFQAKERVDAAGITMPALAESLRRFRGKGLSDRTYRGKTYRQCFIASEAVDWLATQGALARADAVNAGRMLQGFGVIHHVVRERAFDDALLYFRFDADGPGDEVDLNEIATAMRAPGGVEVRDRTWMGRTYSRCFTGTEAVDWLVAERGVGIGHAEAIGQRLMDLGVLRHVVDEREFVDGEFFYAFRSF